MNNLEVELEREIMMSLPESLVKEIDRIVESSNLCYTGRTQFIFEAIRAKIELNQKL